MASDWKLLEFDPAIGRAMFGRDVDGGMELKVEYYADPTLEANKIASNDAPSDWKGDYHRIASLSPGIAYGDHYIAQALRENDDRAVSKWLNDPDNKGWRTKEGKV